MLNDNQVNGKRLTPKEYVRSTYSTCFYTGVKLIDDTYSVEHLVSQDALRKIHKFVKRDQWNLVASHRDINSVLGNAPLTVKFAVKEFLSTVTIFPGLDDEKKIQAYAFAATQYMEIYRVNGVMPWRWQSKVFKKNVSKADQKIKRAELRTAYMALLTKEEIELGAYIK